MAPPILPPSKIAKQLLKLPVDPVISSDRADWDNVQLALFHQPPHRIPEHVSPYHVICINAGIDVHLQQSIDGKNEVGESTIGDIGIYPAHLWQSFEWAQDVSFLQLYLSPLQLNEIASELYGKDEVELLPQALPADPMIEQIAIELKTLIQSPQAGSKLYVDALTNTLATHLVYKYTSHQLPTQQLTTKSPAGQLSRQQLKQITRYIDEHLAEELRLAELAGLIMLSPFHFSRLFKRSTGLSPHQYHLHCRILRAKQLIKDKQLPLAQVAQIVGFSSQSHLNYHFKRMVGQTPAAYRRS